MWRASGVLVPRRESKRSNGMIVDTTVRYPQVDMLSSNDRKITGMEASQ